MRSFKIKNARLVYLTLLQMISATVKGNTNHCSLYRIRQYRHHQHNHHHHLLPTTNLLLASIKNLGVPTRFYQTKGALCFINYLSRNV